MTVEGIKVPPVTKHIMDRDDYIEWVISHIPENGQFRIYDSKDYTLTGIDKIPVADDSTLC